MLKLLKRRLVGLCLRHATRYIITLIVRVDVRKVKTIVFICQQSFEAVHVGVVVIKGDNHVIATQGALVQNQLMRHRTG